MTTLDDRFGPLASAIAGRRMRVTSAGAQSAVFSDGTTIFLPASLAAEQRTLAVALQASLVEGGCFAPDLLRALRGRVLERFLALEGHRVASALCERFPGLRRRLWQELQPAAATESAQASLEWARGRAAVPARHALFGSLHPDRVLRELARAESHRQAAARFEIATQAERDPNDTRKSRNSGLTEGPLAEFFRRLFGLARAPGTTTPGARSGGQPFLPGPARAGIRPALPGSSTFVSLATPLREDSSRSASRAARHPEFDVHSGRYRPDWCSVFELRARSTRSAALARVPDGPLRRELARVGRAPSRVRRQRDGDDLDLDAVVARLIDVAAHRESEADERIYLGLAPLARDFSVLLLVDASGSTGDPGARGLTLLEHHVDAAARLLQIFASLGVRVGVYAFRSHGRAAVRLERVLSFQDHSVAAALERLWGLAPEGFTRLGAAVRHASTVLLADAGTRQQLLVVLCDGLAFDIDYEGAYAETDARRALAEARARGVACVCLALGSATSDASLRRVFGGAGHASAATFDDLAGRLPRMFQQAIAMGRRSSARRGMLENQDA